MNAGIFGGVIATEEFAPGLSQLGTDGSNPSPSSAESAANFVFGREAWKGSAETTRDDPDGEYLKRNRSFESGSLQRRVHYEPVPLDLSQRRYQPQPVRCVRTPKPTGGQKDRERGLRGIDGQAGRPRVSRHPAYENNRDI